jgi:predicted nucleic acid-binding protein
MQFVDTNIFLRYLTRDDEEKAAKCRALLMAAEEGTIKLNTSDLVFAELVWVLQSPLTYNLAPEEINEILLPLINIKGLKGPSKSVIAEALDLFSSESIDYIDAYHAALIREQNITALYSYDQHFDLLPDITRREP